MAALTKGPSTAEFLIREANGHRSRDVGTVDATAGAMEPGTILGFDGTNYVRHDADASNGAEDEAAVLYEGIAEGETEDRTLIVRDAEVNGHHLIYEDGADQNQRDASDAALRALGIVVRR